MKVTGIILAAGRGTRMRTEIPKAYLELSGKPVFLYSVFRMQEKADEIIIVTAPELIEKTKAILSENGIKRNVKVVAGGSERTDSSYLGISASNGEIVLIHDAARPFVKTELIGRVIKKTEECGAAVPVLPMADTVKIVKEERVEKTPDRSALYRVQTPQGFLRENILAAYERFRKEGGLEPVTDDAEVLERYSDFSVMTVRGDERNMKLTYPEDLLLWKIFSEEKPAD